MELTARKTSSKICAIGGEKQAHVQTDEKKPTARLEQQGRRTRNLGFLLRRFEHQIEG